MPEDLFLQWTFGDEVERTHTADYETLKTLAEKLKRVGRGRGHPGAERSSRGRTRQNANRWSGSSTSARMAGDQVLVAETLRMVDAAFQRRAAARAPRARKRPHVHARRRPRDRRRLVSQPPVARPRIHPSPRRGHDPPRPDGVLGDAGLGQRSSPLVRTVRNAGLLDHRRVDGIGRRGASSATALPWVQGRLHEFLGLPVPRGRPTSLRHRRPRSARSSSTPIRSRDHAIACWPSIAASAGAFRPATRRRAGSSTKVQRRTVWQLADGGGASGTSRAGDPK